MSAGGFPSRFRFPGEKIEVHQVLRGSAIPDLHLLSKAGLSGVVVVTLVAQANTDRIACCHVRGNRGSRMFKLNVMIQITTGVSNPFDEKYSYSTGSSSLPGK